jgi:hypothetical protein
MAAQQVAAARKTTDAPTFIHALRFSIVRYNGFVKTMVVKRRQIVCSLKLACAVRERNP